MEKIKQLYSNSEILLELGISSRKLANSIKILEEQGRISPSIRLELREKVIKLIAENDMEALRDLKINPEAIKRYLGKTYQSNETKKSINEQAIQMMRNGEELGEILKNSV